MAYHPISMLWPLGKRHWKHTRGPRLIPLTVPEVRALLLRVVWGRLTPPERSLAWSAWRRAHQQHAKDCHSKKRRAKPP